MRKVIVVIGVLAGIVGVGFLIGKLASGPSIPPPVPQPVADVGSTAATQHVEVASNPLQRVAVPKPALVVTPEPMPVETQAVVQVPATNANVLTNWEEMVDNIIGSDGDDTNKVKQLFALFPNLPPDGQEEVAQHLSNLVDDENYAPLADLMKNDKLPEGALDQLLSDALNRPNTLKLPLLVDVAQDPNHPKAAEAKDLLELYLGEDYGNDWNSWRQHMKDWLKDNPD